jgi:tetrahydrodipicolinate N-succinyltransferase
MKFTEIISTAKEPVTSEKRSVSSKSAQREYYINQWQKSDLTRKAFCKEHSINLKTFSNWLGKASILSKRPDCAIKKDKLPMPTLTSIDNHYRVKLQWPNGIQLNIDGACGAALIVSIIKGTC